MTQSTIVLALIFLAGIALVIIAMIDWQRIFGEQQNFFTEKINSTRSRFMYGIMGFLMISMGIYLYKTQKLEKVKQPEEEILFQF